MVVTLKSTKVHACYTVRWFSLCQVKTVRAGTSSELTSWVTLTDFTVRERINDCLYWDREDKLLVIMGQRELLIGYARRERVNN